jgi:hypothetical protein
MKQNNKKYFKLYIFKNAIKKFIIYYNRMCDKHNEILKNYYVNNTEHFKKYFKDYYEMNKDELKHYARCYYENNKNKMIESRRARSNSPVNIAKLNTISNRNYYKQKQRYLMNKERLKELEVIE